MATSDSFVRVGDVADRVVVDLDSRRNPPPPRAKMLAELRTSVADLQAKIAKKEDAERRGWLIEQDQKIILAGMKRLAARVGAVQMIGFVEGVVARAREEMAGGP